MGFLDFFRKERDTNETETVRGESSVSSCCDSHVCEETEDGASRGD